MTMAATIIKDAMIRHRRLWLLVTLGLPVVYVAAMIGSLMIRFGNLPNYVTFYDWPGNVVEIVRSTPSISDMLPIILEEWLIEVGYMNYDFGNGISEWSMSVIPSKLAVVTVLGALLATVWVLARRDGAACSAATANGARAAAGVGAGLATVTSLTMTWVVCCATPSWVVGLAMLGVGTSTALVIENVGLWLTVAGLLMLIGAIVLLARNRMPGGPAVSEKLEHEHVAANGHAHSI